MQMLTPHPPRWRALAILAVAQFLVIMDTSIIGVALPQIQQALGFSQADLSWVFNAYVVAFGGLLLLGGKLADLFGARRIFILGFAILTGASLLTGVAGSGLRWPTLRTTRSQACSRSSCRACRSASGYRQPSWHCSWRPFPSVRP